MDTQICSLNVKGLGARKKRLQVVQCLKDKDVDICLLQETHLTEALNKVWEQEWGGQCFFNGISSNSTGVSILLNHNRTFKIKQCNIVVEGRMLALELEIDDNAVSIINIYGPNYDKLGL